VSADLEYGVTVHVVGFPNMIDVANSIKDVIAATRVLERGSGEDIAAKTEPSSTIRNAGRERAE
jgi:hypothetical protein